VTRCAQVAAHSLLKGTSVFDGRFRSSFEIGFKPVGRTLSRAGIRADHLTVLGVVVSVGAALAIGNGALRGGFLLLALAGLIDVLDGAVAKASGSASPRGAFFDSVADRLSDALLFGGVAWYLAATQGGHTPLLPMAVLAGAMLISYERAKAESLGFDARGGIMERAERFVLLGLALLFDWLLIPILWLMLGLIAFTAVQRFTKVWIQASAVRDTARSRRRTARSRSRRSSRGRGASGWSSRMRTSRER
jgi:CDP-diacylglycerol---glycerol-3-phosphate 3-phosphatidyltransferase